MENQNISIEPQIECSKISDYLQASLRSDDKKYCRGWEYLKENTPDYLKAILEKKEYWDITYNDDKVEFIIKELKADLTPELKKQLGSFVYVRNEMKQEQDKAEKESRILSQGYRKIYGSQRELHGLKVKGLFNISTIGIMGSFDSLKELEGRLEYAERFNSLMLIPKRSRTKGYVIRQYAYIKYEGGEN